MKRLGGACVGFDSVSSSSMEKGESIADTAKMLESYCDGLVIRHELEGVSQFISEIVNIPVINAGDGAGQHPTQTLLDLYTMREEFGHIENLNVALVGDLKYGRTVHSLAYALGLYNVNMTFVSPNELRMPKEILRDLEKIILNIGKTLISMMSLMILMCYMIQESRKKDSQMSRNI